MANSASVDVSVAIIVALTAGLFSLLGVFVGAALSKRTEYEKWLRANRSEVFARFLELVSQAQRNATDAMFDKTLDEVQQNIKATEAYSSALEYARVVCLYLPEKQRNEFRTLAQEFYALHTSRGLGDARLLKMPEKLEAMQKIFESNL